MSNEGHSVAIVEDHGALRIFLRDVLQQRGWTVTGFAGSAESGAELVLGSEPTSRWSNCTWRPRAACRS